MVSGISPLLPLCLNAPVKAGKRTHGVTADGQQYVAVLEICPLRRPALASTDDNDVIAHFGGIKAEPWFGRRVAASEFLEVVDDGLRRLIGTFMLM